MHNPALGFFAAIALFTALPGCGKPVNPNDLPVSHWADPKTIGMYAMGFADDCTVANAQAIVKSGLPFPNFGTKDELAADGKTVRKRVTTVDYWLGGERFVFPAEIATSSSYPLHNPYRYNALSGTLPNFYPKGPAAPVKDGMGPMVEVTFTCMMNLNDPRFVDLKTPRSNDEGIENAKNYYKDRLTWNSARKGEISVNIRKDIKMIEVLMDKEFDKGGFWEATYWPLDRELKDSTGYVSAIRCQTRNDPEQKRYGGRGWTCSSGIKVNPYVSAGITIYVSHLEQMPSIYDQVQQVIINAKKAAE